MPARPAARRVHAGRVCTRGTVADPVPLKRLYGGVDVQDTIKFMGSAVNPYYSGQPTDHFDGVRFFNPGHPETDRDLRDLLRWKLRGKPAVWPRAVAPRQAVPDARVDGLRATVVGHASVLIQAGGLNVLTDPVWSERASPLPFLGPRRVWAPGIAFQALPRIDAVLLSHNHYDHMDMQTLRRLSAEHGSLIVAPLGNDAILPRDSRCPRGGRGLVGPDRPRQRW
jgi:Beta-lactamase superfamily domain